MAFLGGLGTISGPVLGALIIEPAQQYLTISFSNSYLSQILLGALFLAVVLFVPRGLIPTLADRGKDWLERRQSLPQGSDVGVDMPAPAKERA
jgi:branched-chain amino acid transport system permease protein